MHRHEVVDVSMSQHQDARDDSRGALRTQLWCPGVAYVTPQGDIRLGPSAGYASRHPSFRRQCFGRQSSVSSWTHTAWLAARGALDAATIAKHGIILPEALIDRDELPHAHRWLREQPLVCLSGATWTGLAQDGVTTYRVALDAIGNRTLRFDSRTDAAQSTSLNVSLDRLHAAANVRGDVPLLTFGGNSSPVDRVLRTLSGGVVDEASLTNAFDARSLIENGYGYHGAPEGHFADLDFVTAALGSFNALFGQIFERATPMLESARQLARSLANASPSTADAPVPIYRMAHAVTVPRFSVRQVEKLVIDGATIRDLEVPTDRRWTVGVVESWGPQLPAHMSLKEPPWRALKQRGPIDSNDPRKERE